ncbi:hypothetical protein BDF20DRAFT_202339 [Mycotypha africana]|uniref:uncharacterized protein n=1 Tax=Mycotypha africana TaxID=64632 RepID=UPI002301622D|nr:uncharacterized protein BDF20DRAFT_202339 [Mycotypha africana]KAI8967988.1 hypothetical protein BDF20DRAFT_202339 [Mycotypha africana]
MSDPSRWHANELHRYSSNNIYSVSQHMDPHRPNDHYDSTAPHSDPHTRPVAPAPPPPTTLRPLQPSPYTSILSSPLYPPVSNQSPTETSVYHPQDMKLNNKRTRITRACDTCRRRKVKCDTSLPGNTCKNCKSLEIECTYNDW